MFYPFLTFLAVLFSAFWPLHRVLLSPLSFRVLSLICSRFGCCSRLFSPSCPGLVCSFRLSCLCCLCFACCPRLCCSSWCARFACLIFVSCALIVFVVSLLSFFGFLYSPFLSLFRGFSPLLRRALVALLSLVLHAVLAFVVVAWCASFAFRIFVSCAMCCCRLCCPGLWCALFAFVVFVWSALSVEISGSYVEVHEISCCFTCCGCVYTAAPLFCKLSAEEG